MFTREEIIRRIGYHNWDAFEAFMVGRHTDWDEYYEEPLYCAQDIDDFRKGNDVT